MDVGHWQVRYVCQGIWRGTRLKIRAVVSAVQLDDYRRDGGMGHEQEKTVDDARREATRDEDRLVPLDLIGDGADSDPNDGTDEGHHAPDDASLRHRQPDLLHVQPQVGEQARHGCNTYTTGVRSFVTVASLRFIRYTTGSQWNRLSTGSEDDDGEKRWTKQCCAQEKSEGGHIHQTESPYHEQRSGIPSACHLQ